MLYAMLLTLSREQGEPCYQYTLKRRLVHRSVGGIGAWTDGGDFHLVSWIGRFNLSGLGFWVFAWLRMTVLEQRSSARTVASAGREKGSGSVDEEVLDGEGSGPSVGGDAQLGKDVADVELVVERLMVSGPAASMLLSP